MSPRFPIPLARYCPYFSDLTYSQDNATVKTRVTTSKNINAGGICFFNLPMQPTRLSTLNAAAQAFGLTVKNTGKTYSKDYGN